MARNGQFLGWGTLALALSLGSCGSGNAPEEDQLFTEPEREEGDILCDLTGTYETSAECDRFAEQYGKLTAGVDAFNPSETMIADEATIVRYAIVRLDDSVQGEDGEIAEAAEPEEPAPAPTEEIPDILPPPAPVPVETETPDPGPETSSVPPTAEPVIGSRPILIDSPDLAVAQLETGGVPAQIVIPEAWEESAYEISAPEPLATESPAPSPVPEASPEPVETPEPATTPTPAPVPVPVPEETTRPAPTQEEIDSAITQAEALAGRSIGRDDSASGSEIGRIKIGRIMYACLEADPSFIIEPAECQPKNTVEDPDPVWRWQVTPTEPGDKYQLKLRSGIVVEASDGGLRKIGQPGRIAEIDVKVTTLGAAKRFFATLEEWLRSPIGALGGLAALLIAIGGVRRAWNKMRSNNDPEAGDEEAAGEENAEGAADNAGAANTIAGDGETPV